MNSAVTLAAAVSDSSRKRKQFRSGDVGVAQRCGEDLGHYKRERLEIVAKAINGDKKKEDGNGNGDGKEEEEKSKQSQEKEVTPQHHLLGKGEKRCLYLYTVRDLFGN